MMGKWLNGFTVAVFLTLVSLFIYSQELSFFQTVELKVYDLKVRSRGTRPISGQVVIIAVDEKSLKMKGRWPWSRFLMAELVDRLTAAEASVIGFDIFFPEPEDSISIDNIKNSLKQEDAIQLQGPALVDWLEKQSNGDQKFAEAIERSQRTVLGFFVYPTEDLAGEFAQPINQTHLDLLDFSQFSMVQGLDLKGDSVFLRQIYSLGMSLSEMVKGANSGGFVSFIPEVDGVIRWVPMVMQSGQALFPPLALQMLHEATNLPTGVRLAPYGVNGVQLGDTEIPTSESGDFLVNYFGPAFTFTHYSAADVLSGKIGIKELQNKIVLIGGTAAGTHDLHVSPYGTLYPGVEIHANVIENILQGNFLIRPEGLRLLDMIMMICSGLLLGFISRFLNAYSMAIFAVAGLGVFISIDYYLFTYKGLWVQLVYPVFSYLFVYSGITIYHYAFETREKRFIKEAFSQYLAPEVVNRLVDNPSLLKLGGERKVLTAFFSDVAGFSTISEKLSPEELVDLLNHYLTEMTDIILKYEGTVDKFEGDAIIAFFGAPVPYEDHARRACLASMEMQQRLAELRSDWRREGKHELFMRIGVNTGQMVVGNMGSKSRMDYTMMGDSVNLAARLEGVNKEYKTYTMISQFTYEQARNHIETRELDLIRVVGKNEPITIYEVLGAKGQMDEKIRDILPHFNEGISHYRKWNWREGIACFEKALSIHAEDGPSLTYLKRCQVFLKNPPNNDWDGVYSMQSK